MVREMWQMDQPLYKRTYPKEENKEKGSDEETKSEEEQAHVILGGATALNVG